MPILCPPRTYPKHAAMTLGVRVPLAGHARVAARRRGPSVRASLLDLPTEVLHLILALASVDRIVRLRGALTACGLATPSPRPETSSVRRVIEGRRRRREL